MPNSLPPDVVSACVVASTVDTPYRAAGRGTPIVVLAASAKLQAELLEHAPRNVRVVVPTMTGDEPYFATTSSFADWLINFVDALGIARCSLLADATLAAHATEFTFHFPERVGQLALLQTDHSAVRSFAAVPNEGISARALVMKWAPEMREPAAPVRQLLAQLLPISDATTEPPP